MTRCIAIPRRGLLKLFLAASLCFGSSVQAASAIEMTREAETALQNLYQQTPDTRRLGEHAVAILVFPSIVKAGLLVGGENGSGTLFKKGKSQAFYDISAASFGLQAGAQTFGYALFFMNEKALKYLDSSDGWSVGVGPSVVVWNAAAAASVTTTTVFQDVYAVPFGQKGVMAGIGIEGSKITRMNVK